MTENNAFERFVADHLADDGSGSAQAERLAALIHERTSGRRQWPRWLAVITEPPMRTNNHLAVGSPTVRVAAIMVATFLLAVALAAAGAGAQRLLAADDIVVALDGSGDHTTIAAAVAAATDGDRIVVRPGTYPEALFIDKSISLVGDGGRDAVVIAFPADAPGVELSDGSDDDPSDPLVTYSVPAGIQLAGTNVAISGLTVSGPRPGIAIAVNAGTSSLEDLAISLDGLGADEAGDPAQDTRVGVLIAEGAAVDLRDSALDADAWAGEGGSVAVEGSVFTGGGIWGEADGDLVATDNVLTDASIWSGGASGVIDGNELSRGFISVGGDGTYRVSGNHVDGLRYDVGPGVAISIWDAGDVEVTGNTVTNSDTGIKTLFFDGTARIEGNTVTSTRTGISVSGADTTVSDNTVEGSDIIGLEVYSARPTVTGNTITGGTTGLHLADPDVATVTGNTVCDNTTNVRVVMGEMPDLSANDICEDGTD